MKAIEEMTSEEKLKAIEAIWDSLCPSPEAVPSPEWHGKILEERAARVLSDKAVFSEWDDTKKRLSGQA